ncbi:protein Flattop isoform X2 [Pseudophryne corroboree]|uniref:protein Flattop isoform X2 n=1 Tax=Pseudophryne corroboree TaxID=495146 RepID=UPI0030819ED0
MAAHYSANQYQSSFNSNTLQNWNIPKPYKEASPWGTFIGTWDMPTRIPPTKLSLTSRSADASKRLVDWIQGNGPLISACNGLRPDITGKITDEKQEPQKKSPSPKSQGAPVTPTREVAAKTPPRSSAASPSGSHTANRASPKGQHEEGERKDVEQAVE